METIQGTFKNGQVVLDAPTDWPDGCRVQVEPLCDVQQDPEVILPPGLRNVLLRREDAHTMQRLLDDSSQPSLQGKEMPTADASILAKKSRVPKS